MALLGAAVLSRRASGVEYAGKREPLELQALAALALSDGEEGEDVDALATALACDPAELRHVAIGLFAQGLIEPSGIEEDGDERIAITEAGGLVVEAWIARVVSLFPRWPPDHPDVDDAIG